MFKNQQKAGICADGQKTLLQEVTDLFNLYSARAYGVSEANKAF
jgi:hypothetical protein